MLTENDIVDEVVSFLKSKGWTISGSCNTVQRGVDIVAIKGEQTLMIEAKGQTSSKEISAKFGKEFSYGQKVDHIAKALLKSAETMEKNPNANIAMAFPKDAGHYKIVSGIRDFLSQNHIAVYWVEPDTREVSIQI